MIRSRSLAAAVAVVLAVAAGSCAEPRDTVVELAELAPVAARVVRTDSIDLASSADEPLLARGWSRRPFTGEDRGRLVIGLEAVLYFGAVGSSDLALEIDLRPHQPAGVPPQRVALSVNGRRLVAEELEGGWNRMRAAVPGEFVVPGRNEVELRFARAPRPADHAPDRRDERPVAALVRRVRLRPSTGRPMWSGSPPEIEWSHGPPTTMSMPTDSLLDVYLRLPQGARLVGGVEFQEADETEGTARWSLEVADEAGGVVQMLDRELGSGDGPRQIDVDLRSWADVPSRLRFRTVGDANGFVVARELRITAPAGIVESMPPAIPELIAPSGTGGLGRPDVFVILLDAARADAFACYGSPHPTPAVDGLAKAGTRFVRAYAPSAWTGQSVPALLTGRYPDATGSDTWTSPLPDEVPTLAEILAGAGYRTALWSQHAVYRGNETFRRGFDAVTTIPRGERDRLPEMKELRDPELPERPVFAVVHLVPPHGDYRPPRPFRGRLTSWYGGDMRINSEALRDLSDSLDRDELDAEKVRYARLRYQENVLYADHLVGRFLERLRAASRYDDALIFIVSDHGEAFWEHGRFLHTHTLYEEMLRIPFVVKWPAGTGRFVDVVETPVGLIDVAATVVDGVAPEAAEGRFQGRSLLGMAAGGAAIRRPIYSLTQTGDVENRDPRGTFALLLNDWKLIYDRTDGDLELYDLSSDPGERENVAESRPIRARYLLQRLLRIRSYNLGLDPRGPERSPDLKLDPDVVEELRALGYLQ